MREEDSGIRPQKAKKNDATLACAKRKRVAALGDMETMTHIEDAVHQKIVELCEALLQQPQLQDIRRRMDSFMADTKAQQQYESLSEKGRMLHDRQHQGQPLDEKEVAAFDADREAFFKNPVAKGFVDAQEEMHHIQTEIQQYVTKAFELGRVPTPEDMQSGSCGSGCGCH
jgi:cell fate (sporulation/competence/biofilm development) regulator YlbF (YheA/YmcA/DUF963 family)